MPKVDYVVRETASNLTRNFTITLASIMTVVVSLSLVGASLMLRQGVQNATRRWQGGIEFVVFMNAERHARSRPTRSAAGPRRTTPRSSSIDLRRPAGRPTRSSSSSSHDQPELIAQRHRRATCRRRTGWCRSTRAEAPSTTLGKQFQQQARGARRSSYASADHPGGAGAVPAADGRHLRRRRWCCWARPILLILNTIRMAMFARRREIEVMKLVGATNWFIRVPFMLEGLVQGVRRRRCWPWLALASFKPFFEQLAAQPAGLPARQRLRR